MEWRKSSMCSSVGDCLEVADGGDGQVWIRDSKEPDGPMVVLPRTAFVELVGQAKAGVLDHLT